MTLAEARAILQKPVFGSAECLQAKRVVEEHEEAAILRVALKGKKTECWCCEGSGELKCKAGCVHICDTCDGDDQLTLTDYIMRDLELYQLRDLAKELGVAA